VSRSACVLRLAAYFFLPIRNYVIKIFCLPQLHCTLARRRAAARSAGRVLDTFGLPVTPTVRGDSTVLKPLNLGLARELQKDSVKRFMIETL
jgi:hypothetical protein